MNRVGNILRVGLRTVHTDKVPLRLRVYKSNTAFYCQLINDVDHITIMSCSSKASCDKKVKRRSFNVNDVICVGEEMGKKMLKLGINSAVFDRAGYKYHGKISAFADSVRKTGVKL